MPVLNPHQEKHGAEDGLAVLQIILEPHHRGDDLDVLLVVVSRGGDRRTEPTPPTDHCPKVLDQEADVLVGKEREAFFEVTAY